MTTINQKTASLLDKVYNLCGEDSVVFAAIDEEQADAEKTRNETSIAKIELDAKLEELKSKERALMNDGNRLSCALAEIVNGNYADLIDTVGLKFDPVDLTEKLNTRLPEVLDEIAKEKASTKEELDKTVQELSESITKLEELNIRRREAAASQEMLRKYFELALDSNINITRDEITTLLANCGFDENDQRGAAKLLMFPEDGLFDYMIIRNENPDAKSVVDVLKGSKAKAEKEEVQEEVVEEEIPEEEPVLEMEKVLNAMPTDNKVKAEKVLEINPDHAVFAKLQSLYTSDKEKLKKYTQLLYTQSLLIEGISIENPVEFSNMICEIMTEN